MVTNYTVRGMDEDHVEKLMDILDKAVNLRYTIKECPLIVSQNPVTDTVEISPGSKFQYLSSVSINKESEEGKLAMIIRATPIDVELEINDNKYLINFRYEEFSFEIKK